MTGQPRMPAAERKRMLARAGVELARERGARAVTLARVAEACGVTKPVAYRLFGDVATLLEAMELEVVSTYEVVLREAVERSHADGLSAASLLARVFEAYVDHSLSAGAVHDTIAAARGAAAAADEPSFLLPPSHRDLVCDVFGISGERAVLVAAIVLGAADEVVAAIQVGAVARDAGIRELAAVFAPLIVEEGEP